MGVFLFVCFFYWCIFHSLPHLNECIALHQRFQPFGTSRFEKRFTRVSFHPSFSSFQVFCQHCLIYIYIYIREFCFSLILLAVKESQYVVVSFHLIFLWIYLYLLPFLVGYPSHLSLGRILSHRSFHLWLKSLTFYHCTI